MGAVSEAMLVLSVLLASQSAAGLTLGAALFARGRPGFAGQGPRRRLARGVSLS